MNHMGADSGVTLKMRQGKLGWEMGMQSGFGNDGPLEGSGVFLLKVWVIGATWELIRNAESQIPTPESESSCLRRFPGDA